MHFSVLNWPYVSEKKKKIPFWKGSLRIAASQLVSYLAGTSLASSQGVPLRDGEKELRVNLHASRSDLLVNWG